MSKLCHLYLSMQISSQEFMRIWESLGCATDVLFLHTAQTLQKTNMPYLPSNIHLKVDLGEERQKDTSAVLKKNYFQVQTWYPARTHFCPSPVLLYRDSQPEVVSPITGGIDRTAPPWLPRLYCHCGRMNDRDQDKREGYGIPASDRQQNRAIPGSSTQSEH